MRRLEPRDSIWARSALIRRTGPRIGRRMDSTCGPMSHSFGAGVLPPTRVGERGRTGQHGGMYSYRRRPPRRWLAALITCSMIGTKRRMKNTTDASVPSQSRSGRRSGPTTAPTASRAGTGACPYGQRRRPTCRLSFRGDGDAHRHRPPRASHRMLRSSGSSALAAARVASTSRPQMPTRSTSGRAMKSRT